MRWKRVRQEGRRERESFNLFKNQTGRFYCRVKGVRDREWAGSYEDEWQERKIMKRGKDRMTETSVYDMIRDKWEILRTPYRWRFIERDCLCAAETSTRHLQH